MAFGWFKDDADVDVAALILKKSYGRAARALKARAEKEPANLRVLQQLADCLILDGRSDEAIPVLEQLADLFATGGFVAKAIAVLKKLQGLDPSRVDIDRKLARLFREREDELNLATTRRRVPRELVRDEPKEAKAPASAEFRSIPEPEPEPKPEADSSSAMIIQHGHGDGSYEIVVDETAWTDEPGLSEGAGRTDEGTSLGKTPLFSDFDSEELVAVMRELTLRTFESGDIILSEGEPGDSLFILTTGRVKAFVKDARGKALLVRTMSDGAFFGEISILYGKPRTATVTAASPCDLLELDREKLGVITAKHPRVQRVLQEFCEERLGTASPESPRG